MENEKDNLVQVINNNDMKENKNDYLNDKNNNNFGRKNRYYNKNGSNLIEENQNDETKKKEIPTRYGRKKNSVIYINQTKKEEEKNNDQKFMRGNSYNSNVTPNNDNKRVRYANSNNEYNYGNNNENKNTINRRNIDSNYDKRNNPVKLKYQNNRNSQDSFKRSIDREESDINNIKLENYDKNNKNNSKNSIEERISKDTTTNGSKGSITSTSKDNHIARKYENNSNNASKDKDNNFSSTGNNFKNKRKFYMKEKERLRNLENNNIRNEIKNIPNSGLQNRYNKNEQTIIEQNDNDNDNDTDNNIDINKESDKPDDVIEPSDINYDEEIPISNRKIKENKDLYEKIQTGIKNILEKGKLPQFNIDNYTIEKKIGDGAFGVLFSVINNKTNKKYALKKLTASDLNSLEEFQKEFIIAYQSNHKNILNLYGICIRVYDSTTFALFVLMDLAECDWEIEINNRFKEKKFYTEEELIEILKQLSSACAYLQNKKVAHRDIKPENILLFHENNKAIYKICDFGEAKEKIKENQRHKSIRGTDFYMSPILFKGLTSEEKFVKDNAFKSDVFSLGYCMIIACVLDFNFINKIRNEEEQSKIEQIIRSNLEDRYSDKLINLLLKMTVYYEKERVDFIGLEELIKEEL